MLEPSDFLRIKNNVNKTYQRSGVVAEVDLLVRVTEYDEQVLKLRATGSKGTLTSEFDNLSKAAEIVMNLPDISWIITDLRLGLRYKSVNIPSEWLLSITPKILGPNERIHDDFLIVDELSDKNDDVIGSERICSKGDDEVIITSRMDVSSEYSLFVERVYSLYLIGSIVLDQEELSSKYTSPNVIVHTISRDRSPSKQKVNIREVNPSRDRLVEKSSVIDRWELKESKNYKGVYHPVWTNNLLTKGDPSLFLMYVDKNSSYKESLNELYNMYSTVD